LNNQSHIRIPGIPQKEEQNQSRI
jgi:hypothetical protein